MNNDWFDNGEKSMKKVRDFSSLCGSLIVFLAGCNGCTFEPLALYPSGNSARIKTLEGETWFYPDGVIMYKCDKSGKQYFYPDGTAAVQTENPPASCHDGWRLEKSISVPFALNTTCMNDNLFFSGYRFCDGAKNLLSVWCYSIKKNTVTKIKFVFALNKRTGVLTLESQKVFCGSATLLNAQSHRQGNESFIVLTVHDFANAVRFNCELSVTVKNNKNDKQVALLPRQETHPCFYPVK